MSIEPVASLVITRVFRIYFGSLERLLVTSLDLLGLKISMGAELDRKPLDDRLAKIEDARVNLQEALSALGELTQEAERNKIELARALSELETARNAQIVEELKLNNIKQIAQSDVTVFQKMAGINPKLERIVGFIGGIIASLIAALIWHFATKIMN